MPDYLNAYAQATGHQAPLQASLLDPLFAAMKSGTALPPRAQQAVDVGLTAHTLNDQRENPALWAYYRWVMQHYFAGQTINELSARLIGLAFTSAGLFESDLPQPLSFNPWQAGAAGELPLLAKRAVVLENNGVFILLHRLHPTWPLVLQGGNDFNATYVKLIQRLAERGVEFTYLGDLDSKGIQMAEHFASLLPAAQEKKVLAIQNPERVIGWLTSTLAKSDTARSRRLKVTSPQFEAEMDSVVVTGKFVEQEQLLSDYERLIPAWLANENRREDK